MQCRVHAHRYDVGARCHHLAHDRFGEVDDRLQQLAPFFLRDHAFLLLFGGLGCCSRSFRRLVVIGALAVAPHVDDVHQRHRQGARQSCQRREHRKQDVEDRFGIMPGDEGRKQMLADDYKQRERGHEDRNGSRVADVAHPRDEHTGGNQAAAEQQSHRNEQLKRVVEVASEAIAASAARAETPFEAGHAAVIALVIIAEQVQQTV